ncbi:IDEAL domain protein [compost metagenome]
MREGDWVYGIISHKKLIAGYVLEEVNGSVRIKIVYPEKSVIDEAILVEGFNAAPLSSQLVTEDLKVLIDMALSLGDKEWFNELTEELKSSRMITDILKEQPQALKVKGVH